MTETPDEWRSIHQVVPLSVYERWMAQLQRVAIANGISAESFTGDSKFNEAVGPRVQVIEILTILMERSSDEVFRV